MEHALIVLLLTGEFFMAQVQVLEGNCEEVTKELLSGTFSGQYLRVEIEPDYVSNDNDFPPNVHIADFNDLEAKLLAGVQSPKREMLDSDWEVLQQQR